MKVTAYIARFLEEKGINAVFTLQGGMITRILDELGKQDGIKIVSIHHEQAAAFAADAYARITNKPAVAMATSGPGATNLITGIGNCYFDSVPAIFITGQVNTNEQKGDRTTRQIGFQETDIVSIVKPVTKAAFAVKQANDIPKIFNDAWTVAMEGRRGPVLIDVPMNVQKDEIDIIQEISPPPIQDYPGLSTINFLSDFRKALGRSQRPLVLAGHGIRSANAADELIAFIEKFNFPVVSSLLGIDNIPYNHPLRIGFIGTYGNRWANYALGSCDFLLVLGSRLDLRQTGADIDSFVAGKEIFHVDIDQAELNNRITNCKMLNANLKHFLEIANQENYDHTSHEDWLNAIKSRKNQLPDTEELKRVKGINPNKFIHRLSKECRYAEVFTTDVGNNQMWTAQSVEINHRQRFLSSGGMGAMGYALPAAIGASFASGNAPTVCISGDGGFQINIQELQTIRRNNLPVKMVILNNHSLGMIRQFQDAYFNSCYEATVWGYDVPDFAKVAKAYNIDSFSIEKPEEIQTGLEKLWQDPTQPFLLNVRVDVHTNVCPKIMFGSPVTEMEYQNYGNL